MDGVDRFRSVLAALLLTATACGDQATPEAAEPEDEGAAAAPSEPSEPSEPAEPEPVAEPAEPPPSGHAVVRVGALLFGTSTGEVGFELPPLGEGPAAPAGVTVNVVGEKDGRLEVETLVAEPPEHHCAGTLDGLDDFRLRLYVAKSDLLPVVTEEIAEEFEDGTKLRMARGVPLPKESSSLVAGGTPVDVTVPEDSKGLFYEPGAPFSAEGGEGPLHALEGHALTYGGAHTLAEDSLFHERGEGPTRFGTLARGTDTLVTVRNACLEVTALTSTQRAEAPAPVDPIPRMAREFDPEMTARSAGILGALAADEGHFLASPYGAAFAEAGDDEDVWGGLTGTEVGEAFGVGGLGLVGTGRTEYQVKAGTAIVWPDGKPAGQVTSDHAFSVGPREQAGNSCFDVPLTAAPAATIVLCFAPGDVAEITTPSGGGGVGVGGLGLIGAGGGGGTGSGYGVGSGSGFGSSGKKVPRVRQAKAAVKGSLDKDIIRRIVRAHINEVRYCYNQGLVKDPSLEGRVAVQFTISPAGSVPVAVVADSSIKDENVAKCIAKAVKRWKFPKPAGGGNVVVTYPFVLSPE